MKQKLLAWQFLALPLAIYAGIIIIPFFGSIVYSFTDWNGISETWNFIGLKNYLRVFTDVNFKGALLHNVVWVIFFLGIPTLFGLLMAVLLDSKVKGATLFKSVIYLPMIFSYVIAGMIWTFIYEPRLGIINLALSRVGLDGLTTAWLANPDTALISVILVAAWQHTGLCMILFLAGLQGVRSDLIEAAQLDGCGERQVFWHVVLPQLSNSAIIVISLTVINSLKSFDIVYIMTKGGPFRSSEVLTTLMYREAFWNYQMGYGSAVANMLFFIVLGIIFLYLRTLVKEGK